MGTQRAPRRGSQAHAGSNSAGPPGTKLASFWCHGFDIILHVMEEQGQKALSRRWHALSSSGGRGAEIMSEPSWEVVVAQPP